MGDDHRGPEEQDIVRRTIRPSPEHAEYDLLEVVAELEGVEIEDLPSFYDQVDHLVEMLFRKPPSSETQMQVEFSYAGYRITVDQQGNLTLLDVKKSAPE